MTASGSADELAASDDVRERYLGVAVPVRPVDLVVTEPAIPNAVVTLGEQTVGTDSTGYYQFGFQGPGTFQVLVMVPPGTRDSTSCANSIIWRSG